MENKSTCSNCVETITGTGGNSCEGCLELWKNVGERKGSTIVYLVAGMSSRFGGKIKQFARVGPAGQTLIEYSLDQAIAAGFDRAIFVVGNKTEAPFKEKFGEFYKNIKLDYAFQRYNPLERDKPWGTVDALCSARELISSSFVVCNGDDVYGKDNLEVLAQHLKNETGCATISYSLEDVIPETGTVNRGIFRIENNYVKRIDEFLDIEKANLTSRRLGYTSQCSMNIFAFESEVIPHLQLALTYFKAKNKNNRKAECLLPTEISGLIGLGLLHMKAYSSNEKWMGVTNPEDEEIVRRRIETENGKRF